MSGDFNLGARTVIVHAQLHARRLGHHYVGSEHLLLAVASSDEPGGTVLRAQSLTPEQVEELIVQRVGLGAGPGVFADLDSDALAAIGIDTETVRSHVEAHFTRETLARADRAVHCQTHPPGRVPFRTRAAATLLRLPARRRARHAASKTAEPPVLAVELPGRYRATGHQPPGYIPFTPGAKKTLENASREALTHDSHAGVEHIALALTAASTGPIPSILSAVGTTAIALRTAILDQYRQ